ncbi:hypothetical protein CCACVL1_30802 [Corchorus capsularis]|uniref:Myb/SANT-like domain-containing protein n=1 Tax=Corchorus capsularis TaxID=210143 RepID=A0A1R3FVA4_COCAP|nr:hypothetical protein CCACVL1_30802 [Corchorus capsularis]
MKITKVFEATDDKSKGEKVKAVWDRRLTIIFCDLCIKEISNGNRPGTHFKREGWLRLVSRFEKNAGVFYSQKQLKNRWDLLKKEWKLWKRLLGTYTELGWDPIKNTIDASEDWWDERLKVVPDASKFKLGGIDPELEGKLQQMFNGIAATGNNALAPSSRVQPINLADDDHEQLEVLFEGGSSADVQTTYEEANGFLNSGNGNGNDQEPKFPVNQDHVQLPRRRKRFIEQDFSQCKNGKKSSTKQVGGAAKLSSQIEKLCAAADTMSQATSQATTDADPYGIPTAIKVLDSLSEEVPKSSQLYFFSLKLMVNKEKRIVFLSISPEIRVWWLKAEMEESSKFSSLIGP